MPGQDLLQKIGDDDAMQILKNLEKKADWLGRLGEWRWTDHQTLGEKGLFQRCSKVLERLTA